ncbi:putative bifunctional diguanylate cyclase/phosphodiesterase [Oceanicoccus sagamiensis]|uniref:GGDEF-domain containing protein n=1 Tax=Oceanicoccus sagamiensis TaxID=716816 RepID=A0A1X9N8L8_9GAMM|nr:bifunctional diguanylate cyclase/phosphodiesterase [Oceanicoccus sagamiensis]ARN72782.1 hypothetical protein BST96_00830 [Oceanicoccus sagamiensis]
MSESITAEPVNRKYNSARLKQILFATQIALLLIVVQRAAIGNLNHAAYLLVLMFLLSLCGYIARKGRPELGGTIFAVMISCTSLYFMWTSEGARDETLLAFPGIFVFSLLMAHRIVAPLLLGLFIINVLLMGYFHDAGIHEFPLSRNSTTNSILIAILITIACYWCHRVSRELNNAFKELIDQNRRLQISEANITQLAHHDFLTGLPNRSMAKEYFEIAKDRALRNYTSVSLMFLDLDDFKTINDTLGHDVGDEYITYISRQLEQALRKSDHICRLGGDEFLIILEDAGKREEAMQMADKVTNVVKNPLEISDHQVSCTATIGIAIVPDDGTDFDTICRKADVAMYHGKDTGKNTYHFFDESMDKEVADSLSLIADLRSAIAENQLAVHFQPQIDLQTGRISTAEALLRWYHPTRGSIPPLTFIPLAEKSGEMVAIGKWVIAESCRQCVRWNTLTEHPMTVAVNVSPLQFKHADFAQFILSTLEDLKMDPALLELEFTESLLMNDSPEVSENLAALRKANIHLSIDDFGTGYSNLGYLKNFDIEVLKIDRSFISKLSESPQDKAIVTAIVQMAASLGIETVAEGIEDDATAKLVRELNCQKGQGYLWSRPINDEEFINFLKQA